MNMQREIPVVYRTVPLLAVGIFEPAEEGVPAWFILTHARAGGVDVLPLLTNLEEGQIEELALRVIEEGR